MKSVRMGWIVLLLMAAFSAAAQDMRPAGWTDESHGNRVAANYDVVLPDDRVSEIYITFSPEAWQAEEEDMVLLYGERGSGGGPGGGAGGGPGGGRGFPLAPDPADIAERLGRSEAELLEAMQLIPDFEAVAAALELEIEDIFAALGLPPGFRLPGADRRRNAEDDTPQFAERNPIWVPVTVEFGGETWWEVGFRYKGNSTLASGWGIGQAALPFKLDFDEFEDEHPELDNQRFYGFKQMTFGLGLRDNSLQREKVAADIFRAAGVPAAETAFYAVYVDNGAGDGFEYWGIYTAVELPDDTLIETQFADDGGNMYKPEGPAGTFVAGSFTEAGFDKETNRDSSYEDVLAVFDALHAETRLSDPAAWRAGLEAVFDVDGFLRWLAVNTLMQNWDTYGRLSHNYYLYADRSSGMLGRLVWIPWDNNEALRNLENEVRSDGRILRDTPALSLEDVDAEEWPLIGFLTQDAVYSARYVEWVAEVSAEVFTPQQMTPIYEQNYALLAAYVRETEGDAADELLAAMRAETDALIAHVQQRADAAAEFLAG